ncbi:L-rhamnose mutarotase [Mucilaginibacter dorajii]|nr:L-rhamnose mutarotase [Mucilaginibacter dorajii]
MKLFPGKAQEYKKRHDEIWPELVALLKQSGISDYYIYLDEETNILFGTYKVADIDALEVLPRNPVMQKWWQHMSDIMESNTDHSPVSSPLVGMFYLE